MTTTTADEYSRYYLMRPIGMISWLCGIRKLPQDGLNIKLTSTCRCTQYRQSSHRLAFEVHETR